MYYCVVNGVLAVYHYFARADDVMSGQDNYID